MLSIDETFTAVGLTSTQKYSNSYTTQDYRYSYRLRGASTPCFRPRPRSAANSDNHRLYELGAGGRSTGK